MDCRPSRLLLLWFALATALGCAGPSAARPLDTVFAEIQEHEATIAHRSADAEDCDEPAGCEAMSEVCAAADAICDLARETEDPDAAARCALAHRQCRAGGPTPEEGDDPHEQGTSAPLVESAPAMPSSDDETPDPENTQPAEAQPEPSP
ncbi:MAG: hypothetical protein AB8I08_22975 [Sandaracinaceae bacterium]